MESDPLRLVRGLHRISNPMSTSLRGVIHDPLEVAVRIFFLYLVRLGGNAASRVVHKVGGGIGRFS